MGKKVYSVLSICGACISFYIGAGFATMQEIMQYEVSYGSCFPLVIVVAAIIYIYTNLSFAANGNNLHLTRGGDIYGSYCSVFGKRIGRIAAIFFDYFSSVFCFMSFVVMCGGANSTVTQQWGLPFGVGAMVLTFLVIMTVVFGLDGIVTTLGKIGPIIIAMILLVSLVTGATAWNNLPENISKIDKGIFNGTIKQIGDGDPFAAGASYGGFVILWFASFLAEIGSKNKLNEVNIGMMLSALFIFSTSSICCVALISNIGLVSSSDIPALILAQQISPFLALLFAIIICAGIYSSATPLLWTAVRKVADEGTPKYIIITITAGIIGCSIACFVPYKGLINFLYGVNGYLGFILIFVMVVHDIKAKILAKRVLETQ